MCLNEGKNGQIQTLFVGICLFHYLQEDSLNLGPFPGSIDSILTEFIVSLMKNKQDS